MLKIVSPSAELVVLRGLCHKDKKVAGTLVGLVDQSYFYSEESVEVFNAIKKHTQESGESPTYRLLIEDPDLSEEARTHFRASVATVQTTTDAHKAARILDKYRKRRGLYNLAAHINSKMQGSRVDMDALLEETSEAFGVIRSKRTEVDAFLHFGRNNNADSTIKSLLYDDNTENVIPTGIKAFDTVSGGFSRGSLVTVGASSGGGKSLFANALAIKMASMGYKVLLVPLEMSKREMAARTLANVANMNLSKILLNRLATGEKELAYKRYARWKKRVKEAGGRYTIFKPQEDMTMEDIIAATNTYAADVRIVDYISLLKGMDGDDMWRALGAVARFAKINAEVENCINILLVQVNDEGKVRYSRAITEHCVTGDTLVDTDKGLVRIDSLYPEANMMSTKELTGVRVKSEGQYRDASAIHYNGVRDVYEVLLDSGHAIRCTSQHRFRYLDNKGHVRWEHLKDLRANDFIQIDHGESVHSRNTTSVVIPQPNIHHNSKHDLPKKLTVGPDLAYILGCTSSDGYVGKYSYQFIASDQAILDKFVSCWSKVFGKDTCTVRQLTTPAGVAIWRVFARNEISCLFESIEGMRGHAQRKLVPDILLGATRKTICSYLAGLFDGDGSFQPNVGSVHSVNDAQLRRVQLLLGRLGIKSNILYKYHTLTITGASLQKFARLIPITEQKQQRITIRDSKDRSDTVPNFVFSDRVTHDRNQKSPRLRSLAGDATKLCSKLVKAGMYYQENKLGSLNFENLKAVRKACVCTYAESWLDDIAEHSDYARYARIIRISKVGKEKVYDLTVPETENYVANGIVVHNSSNSFIWTVTNEQKETGVIRIEQPKSRNSMAFPFSVKMDWEHMRVEDIPFEDTSGLSEVKEEQRKKRREDIPNLADI